MMFPFVPPKEAMKAKAEFAQQGIAKGRTSIAITYDQGVLLVAQNSSESLYKTSEIHDHIGFIAVGKYAEFEALRVAGIRMANQRAWSYSRADVQASALVRAFASTMSHTFITSPKPLEVELILAEVSPHHPPVLYKIRYDGAIQESATSLVIGGKSDIVAKALEDCRTKSLAEALQHASSKLGINLPKQSGTTAQDTKPQITTEGPQGAASKGSETTTDDPITTNVAKNNKADNADSATKVETSATKPVGQNGKDSKTDNADSAIKTALSQHVTSLEVATLSLPSSSESFTTRRTFTRLSQSEILNLLTT